MAGDKEEDDPNRETDTESGDAGEIGEEGARVPAGHIDPELIALPRKKARVGAFVSLSVIVLSSMLVAKLWPDLRFQWQGQPRHYDDVSALLAEGSWDEHVAVRAVVDLDSGAIVRQSKGSYGHRIQPVFGTNGLLWIMTHSFHWHAESNYDQVYQGRLARLGSMPFFDDVERFLRANSSRTRWVDLASLRSTLDGDLPDVVVMGGDRVAMTPSTAVEIAEIKEGQALVTTYYTHEHPDERSWTLALEHAGLTVSDGRSLGQSPSGESFLYRIEHPGGSAAVDQVLAEKRIYAARVEPVVVIHRTQRGALNAEDDGLELGGESLSWAAVNSVRIEAPYPIDEDARVVIATERPSDYSHVTIVITAISAGGIFFAFILIRPWIRRRPTS